MNRPSDAEYPWLMYIWDHAWEAHFSCDRAEQCEEESNAFPNFVKVDFYDIGDLFNVVESLNTP